LNNAPSEHGAFFEKIRTLPSDKTTTRRDIKQRVNRRSGPPFYAADAHTISETCGAQQDLPRYVTRFYDSLFNVLSRYSDWLKPGCVLQATQLGNADLEKIILRVLILHPRVIQVLSSDGRDPSERSKKGATDIKCSMGFQTDMAKPCLMVKDGFEYCIHSQEHPKGILHLARFIHLLETRLKLQILRKLSICSIF
jgi:hypothetical protein